jgi:glutamine synthetase
METAGQHGVAFGGNVETVLASPRIEPAPATLEQARNAPGRAAKIQALTRRIEAEGIRYVFFQQVSITGRVMGKGVVSTFFAQVAEKGYQLVYGATANLFTDRYGNYIGFGPEESELAAVADLDTFAVLPWDSRVARVYCDCYDTETGELLDADPRQNLKAVAHEFEQELGYQFLIGIEPEMMWLKRPEEGTRSRTTGQPTRRWRPHRPPRAQRSARPGSRRCPPRSGRTDCRVGPARPTRRAEP